MGLHQSGAALKMTIALKRVCLDHGIQNKTVVQKRQGSKSEDTKAGHQSPVHPEAPELETCYVTLPM